MARDRTGLPESGTAWADLDRELDAMAAGDADWRGGRVPLYVFHATDAVAEVGRTAFMKFFGENALGVRRAFASLLRLEDEVVGMALDLFGAPEGAAGHMTTGGSESIFLATKAARERFRAAAHGRSGRPNIVIPFSGHPASTRRHRSWTSRSAACRWAPTCGPTCRRWPRRSIRRR